VQETNYIRAELVFWCFLVSTDHNYYFQGHLAFLRSDRLICFYSSADLNLVSAETKEALLLLA
jgi:hypothetical protein